jgi:hypothetical protein
MTETQNERETRIQSSPQSQNGTFVNPNGVFSKLFSQETWEVAKDYFFTKRIDPKPLVDLPIHRLHSEQWKNQQAEQFYLWIYGLSHDPSPIMRKRSGRRPWREWYE